MRKKFITTVAAVAMAAFATSAVAGPNLSLEGKFGFSLAHFWDDGSDQIKDAYKDDKMLVRPSGGLALNMAFSDAFSVQPEIHFGTRGQRYETAGDDIDLVLVYMEVPLLAKFTASSPNRMVSPFVYTGPVLGVCLNAELDGNDVKDNFNDIDFGLAFGAGVNIPMGPGNVVVDFRYTLGLVDVSDDYVSDDLKTGAINYLFGYSMPIGR